MGTGWLDWMFPTMIMWLLNGTIVAGVLAKLLIFGEPITKKESRSSDCYWKHQKQAEACIAKVTLQPFCNDMIKWFDC